MFFANGSTEGARYALRSAGVKGVICNLTDAFSSTFRELAMLTLEGSVDVVGVPLSRWGAAGFAGMESRE